jgi:hypothetical protein
MPCLQLIALAGAVAIGVGGLSIGKAFFAAKVKSLRVSGPTSMEAAKVAAIAATPTGASVDFTMPDAIRRMSLLGGRSNGAYSCTCRPSHPC